MTRYQLKSAAGSHTRRAIGANDQQGGNRETTLGKRPLARRLLRRLLGATLLAGAALAGKAFAADAAAKPDVELRRLPHRQRENPGGGQGAPGAAGSALQAGKG